MATLALPIDQADTWPASIQQAATPANRNALRLEVALKQAQGFQATQPGAPADGNLYVISGDWGIAFEDAAGAPVGYDGLLAYYRDGAWTYWIPANGQLLRIGTTDFYTYDPAGTPKWDIYDPSASAVTSVNGATGAVIVPVPIQIAVGDETSNLTVGTGKIKFRVPFAMTLTTVRASVNTAPTGANLIVDINVTGVGSILSTRLSIDATETTSTTAAAPPVISVPTLADDAEVTIDIDQIGSTVAGAGLKVSLIGYKTP